VIDGTTPPATEGTTPVSPDGGTAGPGTGDVPVIDGTTLPSADGTTPVSPDGGTAGPDTGDFPATTAGTEPTVVPNAVMVVDPAARGRGDDAYALVTDAGTRTVWKLTPEFSGGDDGSLAFTVTVFATYDETTAGAGDFVPTTLTQDRRGRIFVGDGGSTAAGEASVIAYRDQGAEPAEEIDRWDGFTAINGLAASRNGRHVYISQLLGATDQSEEAGSVVRVNTRRDTYTSVDVPAPAGLAVRRGDRVFVAANSTSPATPDDPATPDVDESAGGGQVLRISFADSSDERPLPVTEPSTTPTEPMTPPAPTDGIVPPVAGTDDGTADQGSGDLPPVAGTDDGTADQGSGDVPAAGTDTSTPAAGVTGTSDDGTADRGQGDASTTP
jgi:hypothetical protein